MPRPRQCRYVSHWPKATYFKPCGVPLRSLDVVSVSVEGLEALRLSDLVGLTTQEAAERVRVSRFTYARILAQARQAVAEALVCGKALRVEGGSYALLLEENGQGDRIRRNTTMQVIAVSSEGPALEDAVDPRFGRAGGFVLAHVASEGSEPEYSYLDNGDSQLLPQGAGIKTTEHLCQAGVTVVLSGYVGPKAFEALSAAGIAVVQNMDGMTVGEALRRYLAGEVRPATEPNHEAGV